MLPKLGTLKLIRFNENGTPDNSFGGTGLVTSNFTWAFTPAVAVQTDGKIIVSGAYNESGLSIPPLRRFNADGSVDNSFVPNHSETIGSTCRSCTQKAAKILLLPDGRFYLVGYNARTTSSQKIVAVTRYLSNGAIDQSYGFRGASLL